jgi:uncharacterized protein (DUF2236 family)
MADAIEQPLGAPGWFTPERPIWTVHGSVATFLGGVRALLMQTLHPLALAGIQDHSNYREDPLGRLQRTGAFIAATTYGSDELALKTVRAVARLHDRVVGVADDGRRYAASDPRLLLWVHTTLTDSMLTAYQRFGRDGTVDADGYVADMAVIGRAMGVPAPPTDLPALRTVLAGFGPELAAPADGDVVAFIMRPGLDAGLRPGYATLARAARNSLSDEQLALLGFERGRPAVARLQDRGASMLLRTLRAALVESPSRAAGERRLGLRPALADAAGAPSDLPASRSLA